MLGGWPVLAGVGVNGLSLCDPTSLSFNLEMFVSVTKMN